ncbi:glucoamylase family protein [Niabella hibiscisoli]|uniref:glucoamylase family protein n=1 Tax=Niabella hibiscisoli TaxID=1825928 RepID=UPI001F10CD98|nr:glucoamylase family protein [Niabella hibiscisoli]MCH5716569.1 Ig-like domain-containing protein [Niabella hibiscisoli]
MWIERGAMTQPVDMVKNPSLYAATLNNTLLSATLWNASVSPLIKLTFSQPLKPATVITSVTLKGNTGNVIPVLATVTNGDSAILVQSMASLAYLTQYTLTVSKNLQSASGGNLQTAVNNSFVTHLDSSRKFPTLTNEQLLDKVQQQTLKYFWDFAHPTSGMIREGSKHSPDIVTSGGTGFGVMALLAGMERGFVNRTEGLARIQNIVTFLKDKAQRFHGAFPHWMNGASGAVIPFSANDNGADLVETSLLLMGLITARQYFTGADALETNLRNDINGLWNAVEWDWFRQNSQNVLYWHWSPSAAWTINLKVQGWNECLITYVLAASSTTHTITKDVYDNGWARSGAFKNGNTYYNYVLPLGENMGGPLFLAHYSFMGINPNGLSDAYANYQTQTKNHTLINYEYCKANPKSYYGYSDSVWGLTASNIKDGYTASSPTNDQGFIAPTAAISSMPYTPNESMAALKFFYYVLGDKLFKDYGFVDAFSLDVVKNNGAWFADTYLAIDQGPIIVMIENYRSGLLWNLFMSAPEVKSGMRKLGFNGPAL